MKLIYILYQLFIALPILLVATILTCLIIIIGTSIGNAHFWSYYPGKIWSILFCYVLLIPVKIKRNPNVRKDTSYVFVANHQGAFDIFLIYGFLDHHDFSPRPNYWAVLLWTKLMGTTVYNTEIELQEGAHIFAHSRKDGKEGIVYLVINTSWTESTTVELPKAAEVYALTGNGKMRARTMLLNGTELVLGEGDAIPEFTGVTMEGTVEVAPGGCTFFVL